MKKLLFILMAVLSLCACSDSEDPAEVSNKFTIDGKDYPIEKITVSSYNIEVKSGKYTLNAITNDRVPLGKKNYLSAFRSFNAGVWEEPEDGYGKYIFLCDHENLSESSYLLIKENDEDNIIYIEALFGNGTKTVTLTYFGTVDISHIVKKE